MNQVNRQKVLNYLSIVEDSNVPLYYENYESPVKEFDPAEFTIDEMVKRAIILSYSYASYNSETKEYETSKARRRSSLDIWRHIKYYYPNIEIFEVMHSLYRIYNNKELAGLFCPDVMRRVFRKIAPYENPNGWTNYQTPESMMDYLGNRTTDEYGLVWDDWKDI